MLLSLSPSLPTPPCTLSEPPAEDEEGGPPNFCDKLVGPTRGESATTVLLALGGPGTAGVALGGARESFPEPGGRGLVMGAGGGPTACGGAAGGGPVPGGPIGRGGGPPAPGGPAGGAGPGPADGGGPTLGGAAAGGAPGGGGPAPGGPIGRGGAPGAPGGPLGGTKKDTTSSTSDYLKP